MLSAMRRAVNSSLVGMYLVETGERLLVVDSQIGQRTDRVLIDGIQIKP